MVSALFGRPLIDDVRTTPVVVVPGNVVTRSLPPERPRAFAQAERRASAFQIPHRSWLQLGFAPYSLTIVLPTDEVPDSG